MFQIDENISDKFLAETFKQYGPLEDVRIIPNKQVKQYGPLEDVRIIPNKQVNQNLLNYSEPSSFGPTFVFGIDRTLVFLFKFHTF